ncbi:anti sigma factor C-terminal domain-containing protein [Proteinivorax hydrogeniformans]|uniref:Anti sigma factor C-terminal domain-containing protein n=1 Tax=Proteinivorax hydrogeniformans TaxID=1826727 RepID=A0AAU8HRU4_9FIRM
MNFKKLLEKYKEGKASAEEINIVEKELEKYQAIEDYYAEDFPLQLNQQSFSSEDLSNEKFEDRSEIKNINKVINLRLSKVVLASVLAVVLLYVSIFYVVSPIVDRFYYNPAEISEGEYFPDMYFDLHAITTLNLPGYSLTGIKHIESEGFGNYSITYYKHNLFTRENSVHSLELRKDLPHGTLTGLFDLNPRYSSGGFNIVADHTLYERGFYNDQVDNMTKYLQELNSVAYVSAYMTFEEDLSLEEFAEMNLKKRELDFKWVGVRTHDKDDIPEDRPNHLTGFNPDPNDGSVTNDSPDPKKYPTFNLVEHFREARPGDSTGWAKSYEEHYRSLLSYLSNRQDAVEVLETYPDKVEYYQQALDYIDENGMNVFGVLVHGEVEDILELVEENDLISLQIDQALPLSPNLN